MDRAGLYVPRNDRAVMDHLIKVAAEHGWLVSEIIWCWTDVLAAMAAREVDLVVATSLADLPPDRHPRMVFVDDSPPEPDPTRPVIRW